MCSLGNYRLGDAAGTALAKALEQNTTLIELK
jgi:hypothetical protein